MRTPNLLSLNFGDKVTMPPKPKLVPKLVQKTSKKNANSSTKSASTTALGASNNVFQAQNVLEELKAEWKAEVKELKAELKAEMLNMQAEITNLQNEISCKDKQLIAVNKELLDVKKSVQYMSDKLDESNENLEQQRQHFDNIHNRIWEVQDKTRDLEDRSRRDNLVFRNIPEAVGEERETGDDCERKLKSELNRCYTDIGGIQFERVHRLGRKKKDAVHPRLIIAKFSSHKDRQFVINNSKNLSKKENTNKMTVSEDFSEDTVAVRRQLWNAAKTAQHDYEDATYIITHVKLVYRRVVLSYKNKSSDTFFSRGYSLYDIQKPGWYTVKTKNSGQRY